MDHSNLTAFSLPIRVYIEDTDAGGIVYHVNYLKYMERVRTEFLRSLGYDKPAIGDDDHLYVVSDIHVRYRQSARLDDELQVTAVIQTRGKCYMAFHQQVIRGQEVLCEATVKVVNVCQKTRAPRPLAKTLVAQLNEMAE